jgi:CNT family concentrative nucleoside transporter
MKFLTDNKKTLLFFIVFTLITNLTFAQNQEIIPSQGFGTESFLRGVLGIIFLIFTTYLLSNNKKAINWRTAGFGLILQLVLAIGVLKVSWIKTVFENAGKIFVKILDFTMEGTKFLFGDLVSPDNFGNVFIFSILPTVIFFAALTSILFYLGIIQKIVRLMALLLSKILGVSGPESLSVAGNIFLGQTESPLMIKAYLEKMSKSEILLVMVGGMATVAGGVLAAYIGFLGGDDPELKVFYAKHLLTASVMAAPGAIVISKILYPETEKINSDVKISQKKIGTNFLDAISIGTSEGLKLAANIAAMLLVFIAFIALINYLLSGAGSVLNINDFIKDNTVYNELSLELILGYLFSPIMWLIGVAKEDITLMGQLLGIKLAASEFIGYIQLSSLKDASNLIHLNYQKSIIIATYMLCGFANFASIGIQIGGIGALEPKQRTNLSKLGFKALIGGTLASLLSATIAGMIIG